MDALINLGLMLGFIWGINFAVLWYANSTRHIELLGSDFASVSTELNLRLVGHNNTEWLIRCLGGSVYCTLVDTGINPRFVMSGDVNGPFKFGIPTNIFKPLFVLNKKRSLRNIVRPFITQVSPQQDEQDASGDTRPSEVQNAIAKLNSPDPTHASYRRPEAELLGQLAKTGNLNEDDSLAIAQARPTDFSLDLAHEWLAETTRHQNALRSLCNHHRGAVLRAVAQNEAANSQTLLHLIDTQQSQTGGGNSHAVGIAQQRLAQQHTRDNQTPVGPERQ